MIILEPYALPEKGQVEIKVNRTFEIKVTAEEARRQVNGWLLNEVSYLLVAALPILVIGEHVVWRAPVWIGLPHTGRVGEVGAVEVDVVTGEMPDLAQRKVEIEQCLQGLQPQLLPYRPKSAPESAEYLAKNVALAPPLMLPGEETHATGGSLET